MVPNRIWIHARKEERVNKISCGRKSAVVKGFVFLQLTGYNFDTSCMTCGDHALVLGSIAAFGGENVRDRLIIRPPLGTLDMFLCRAH